MRDATYPITAPWLDPESPIRAADQMGVPEDFYSSDSLVTANTIQELQDQLSKLPPAMDLGEEITLRVRDEDDEPFLDLEGN